MVNKVIKFKNDQEYLILDETTLDNKKYYLGVRVVENNEPVSTYLFFEEIKDNGKLILNPIKDEETRGLLSIAFTVNFINMTYEEGDKN